VRWPINFVVILLTPKFQTIKNKIWRFFLEITNIQFFSLALVIGILSFAEQYFRKIIPPS
jgi:hypothetical protein